MPARQRARPFGGSLEDARRREAEWRRDRLAAWDRIWENVQGDPMDVARVAAKAVHRVDARYGALPHEAKYRVAGIREETRMRYEVVVGNIGTVYEGRSKREAERTFRDYVLQSRGGYGRAGNEQVVLFEDGEVLREHEGTAEPEENPRRSGLFVPAGRYRRPTARERRLAEARLEIAGPALQEMPSDVRKDVERLVRRGEIEACPVCGGLSAHAYQDTDEATGLNLGIAKVGGTSLSAFQCGHCRRHIAEADSPYAYPMGHGPEEEDEDED